MLSNFLADTKIKDCLLSSWPLSPVRVLPVTTSSLILLEEGWVEMRLKILKAASTCRIFSSGYFMEVPMGFASDCAADMRSGLAMGK